MQIGTVTNQYLNNYHYQGVQEINKERHQKIESMSEYRRTQLMQEQYRDQMRFIAYMLMMQFIAKNQMWSMLNQIRLRRTIDLMA